MKEKTELQWKWTQHSKKPTFIYFSVSSKSASDLPRDERVKVQTMNLLNTILTAGKMLGPLPKKMMLTMKLQYYNSESMHCIIDYNFQLLRVIMSRMDSKSMKIQK